MVCRRRRDDAELTRAGRTPEGAWYTGRGPGRGLWWCSEGGCAPLVSVQQAQRALRKSFDGDEVRQWEQFAQAFKIAVVVKE